MGYRGGIVGMSLKQAPARLKGFPLSPVLLGLRPGSATQGGAGAGREALTKAEKFSWIY